jgi:hypothetical protein
MCGTEEPQLWYGWPDTAACTDVNKKRLIVCVLARWGRTWFGVYQGRLSDCKCMVSGAALNATISLSIL